MPELPEVETIRMQLERSLVGRTICAVDIPVSRVLRMDPDDFTSGLMGAKVKEVLRRGKRLVIVLDEDRVLVFHLMMSGMLLHVPRGSEQLEKVQVVFCLDDGSELRFRDLRKFGSVQLIYTTNPFELTELKKLGPEPLSYEFTVDMFRERLRKRGRARIKPLLMDQSFIAGIGNIYADEALHYAKIHPERLAGTLSRREVQLLYQGIREILELSIATGGSSINTYVDSTGERGRFPEFFKVYGRNRKKCLSCGKAIEKIKVSGRGTHFCPKCQKPGIMR